MQKVASLNGNIVNHDDARLPVVSSAALYGHGVFTTVAVYGGEPFLIEKHWRRLNENAQKLGIDIEVSFEQVEAWLRQLIDADLADDGRARITLLDSGGAGLWTGNSAKKTEILIVTGERFERPDKFRLTKSPFTINSTSPLAGVKSCSYLEHLIAYENAKRQGFDEAVRLNERGEVASAAMANVFWLRNGKLFTSDLATGCLGGTTREFILENLKVEEVSAGVEELLSASAMFVCSAGIGIKQVASLDEKHFGAVDHEILHLLPPKTKTRMFAK